MHKDTSLSKNIHSRCNVLSNARAFALSSNKNVTDFVQAQVCYIFIRWHCSLLTLITSWVDSLSNFVARQSCEYVDSLALIISYVSGACQ